MNECYTCTNKVRGTFRYCIKCNSFISAFGKNPTGKDKEMVDWWIVESLKEKNAVKNKIKTI